MRVSRAIRIACSAERAFSYLADLRRHHEWSGEPSIEIDPASVPGAPAGFRMALISSEKIPGFGGWYGGYGGPSEVPRVRYLPVRVAEASPPERIRIVYGDEGRFREFELALDGEGCRVTMRETTPSGAWSWLRLLTGRDRREIRSRLERIRERLEARENAPSRPDQSRQG